MTRRRGRIAALLGLLLLFIGISFVMFLGSVDGCMAASSNGSCPALADVNGVRYAVGAGQNLIGVEPVLFPYGSITKTNVPQVLAEPTAYSISGIDPAVVLVARSAQDADSGGAFRLLLVNRESRAAAWPALCQYLTPDRREAQPECPKA